MTPLGVAALAFIAAGIVMAGLVAWGLRVARREGADSLRADIPEQAQNVRDQFQPENG